MNNREKFLYNELILLAWGASVQRSNLYKPNFDSQKKLTGAFRKTLVNFFEESLLKSYINPCEEDTHIDNLEMFAAFGTTAGSGYLGPDGYKLGVAQKFLNLMLKYLWCIGTISEPPHCPVDRIIISRTELKGKMNWTEIKTTCEYKKAIGAIKKSANEAGLSVAQWELKVFSRR